RGPSFFFSSRRRHTRWPRDWSSDVCSSDLRPWSRLGVRRCTALTTDAHCTPLPIPPRSAASTSTAGSQKCQSRIASPVVTSPSRSEERRVGKECRARGAPEHEKQKNKERRD